MIDLSVSIFYLVSIHPYRLFIHFFSSQTFKQAGSTVIKHTCINVYTSFPVIHIVLDDNKKLCLSSGEIIKLTEVMTMMFEVQDLAVASPATVSHCGMVYLEPSILGLKPFVSCWLKTLPEAIMPHKNTLQSLFDRFLEV